MIAGLTMLLAKIADAIRWIGDLFVAVFVALWDMAKDAFAWVFDQVMDVAVSAVAAVDVSGLEGWGAWGQLPAELLNVMAVLRVDEAVAIIMAAIGIRLVLQLVPFTRLGS